MCLKMIEGCEGLLYRKGEGSHAYRELEQGNEISSHNKLLCIQDILIDTAEAYVGKSVPEGCRHHTVRRAFRNKLLTETDKVINRHIAKVRCRVEHVFGFIEMSMKGSICRAIGKAQAKINVTLTNLLYNICRFEQIKQLGLPSWA